jgi:hypothetical protein
MRSTPTPPLTIAMPFDVNWTEPGKSQNLDAAPSGLMTMSKDASWMGLGLPASRASAPSSDEHANQASEATMSAGSLRTMRSATPDT